MKNTEIETETSVKKKLKYNFHNTNKKFSEGDDVSI